MLNNIISLCVLVSVFLGSCSEGGESKDQKSNAQPAEEGQQAPADPNFTGENLSFTPIEGIPELPPMELGNLYQLDAENSELTWHGHKVTESHEGKIKLSGGQLIQGEGQQFRAQVIADMTSITCTDIDDEESNQKLVKHLKGSDFFNVEQYPQSVFQVLDVAPSGGNEFIGDGLLFLKGMESPIQLNTVIYQGDSIQVVGSFMFNRVMFGIEYKSQTVFGDLGDKFIKDEVDVDFVLKFYPDEQ